MWLVGTRRASPVTPCRALQPAAFRCEAETPKGVQIATNPRESEGGIDAGEPGGGEPTRRLSGGRSGRSRGQSCAARCRRRRRRCPQSCGQHCRARCKARCAAKPAPATHGVLPRRAGAMPATGAGGGGERSGSPGIIASSSAPVLVVSTIGALDIFTVVVIVTITRTMVLTFIAAVTVQRRASSWVASRWRTRKPAQLTSQARKPPPGRSCEGYCRTGRS